MSGGLAAESWLVGAAPLSTSAFIPWLVLGSVVFGALGFVIGRWKRRIVPGVVLGALLGPIGLIIIACIARRGHVGWSAREQLQRMAFATLGGVCVFLSFPFQTAPDTNLWPLAWVGLVPFLWALRGTPEQPTTGRQGFWLGAWMGLVTNFGGFWWVSEVLFNFGHLPGYVSWPLTALNAFYQGLMWAFVGLWWARAARHGVVPIWKLAAIFTVVEWLFPMIFPWYLANGQYRFIPVIQVAELGGVMAITFTMVAFNAAVFALVDYRVRKVALPRRGALLAFAGTAAVIVYGVVRMGMVESDVARAETFRLGLVEANIGIFEKQAKHLPPREQALTLHRNLLRHQEMSAEVAARGADLVVWPESSYFPLDDAFIKRSDAFALGLTRAGELLVWRDSGPAAARFAWSPLDKTGLASGALGPGLNAVAAAREDAWAAVGSGGRVVLNGAVVASGTPANLVAVGVIEGLGHGPQEDRAPVTVWAAGEGGVVVRLDGGQVKSFATPSGATLRALALSAGRTGWGVGDGGVVVRIDGNELIPVVSGTSADLRAVWIDPGGEGALVAGRFGALQFIEIGGRLAPQTLPAGTPAVDFSAIAADQRGVVTVAGTGGVMLTRKAGAWVRDDLPERVDVVRLAPDARGVLLAADASGRVWERAATGWRDTGARDVVALAPLPYVQTHPLPRDVRYVQQGAAPLPLPAAQDAGQRGLVDPIDPAADIAATTPVDRAAVQRGFTTPILFGGLTWEPPPPGKERRVLYNTAILLDEVGKVLGTYDKVFLLAFGEFMPFGDAFPWLYDAFPTAGRFTPGTEVRTFHWGTRNLGIMICYEDIMAGFTSKLADLEPDIIINVTNDAWFGRTSEPYLHLALAVFRAIENRRALVRSTNTGVSAVIDPTGRIVGQTSIDGAETLVADVPLLHGKTVYGTVGDLFVWLLAAGLVAEGVIAWQRRRRASTGATTGGKA